jgi:predicted DNA-binding transcriptional regulator YafY
VIIEPYGLVWKAGEWYVVGMVKDRHAVERFRVNSLERATTLGQQFALPPNFDLRGWWSASLEAFGKGTIKVVLVAEGDARAELRTLRRKGESQLVELEDRTVLTLFVDRWEWLLPLILSYSGLVQVAEPEQLRDAVVAALQRALTCCRGLPGNDLTALGNSRRRATRGRPGLRKE